MKRNFFLQLLFALTWLGCICGCKKKDDSQSCIVAESPIGNNVSIIDTRFSWTTCLPGQNTVYILKDSIAIDSVITTSTNFIYSKTLLPNYTYQWYINHNGEFSDTVNFTTDYPDSFLEGSYSVTASYHAHQNPGQNPVHYDTIYGPTTITIKKKLTGVVTFSDSILLHRRLDLEFNPQFTAYDTGQFFYGDYHSDYVIYKYKTREIYVKEGALSPGGSYGTEWNGTKN
ncbi:MAG: hypothetical protein KA149_03155 [Chitinophagales bacterium]|nr:hypothetical protein [Chitinophagales bacterium]